MTAIRYLSIITGATMAALLRSSLNILLAVYNSQHHILLYHHLSIVYGVEWSGFRRISVDIHINQADGVDLAVQSTPLHSMHITGGVHSNCLSRILDGVHAPLVCSHSELPPLLSKKQKLETPPQMLVP